MFASQLSVHCDVIANRLWRHQQNVKRARHSTGIMCEDPRFSVIYGFVMSCKKLDNVCTLVTNCLCTHSSVILVFISCTVCATREINTKITLLWAHKQFATRVHTLFSIYPYSSGLYSCDELFMPSLGCYFWCLFPSSLRISENKHQNNPLVNAWTVRHSSPFIILYSSTAKQSRAQTECINLAMYCILPIECSRYCTSHYIDVIMITMVS